MDSHHNEQSPGDSVPVMPCPAARRVVLDTSLFVNPDARTSLGDSPTEALETFLFLAAQIHILEFYMPPSIFEELLHFVDKDKIPGDLLVILHQKPPKRHELKCPAFLLYELIDDMRERVNKGLRIAEKAVRGAEKKKAAGAAFRIERGLCAHADFFVLL